MKFFWPKNWEKSCEILMKNSFLRKSQKEEEVHYSLFPFMTKYVEEHLNMLENKNKIINLFVFQGMKKRNSIKRFWNTIRKKYQISKK